MPGEGAETRRNEARAAREFRDKVRAAIPTLLPSNDIIIALNNNTATQEQIQQLSTFLTQAHNKLQFAISQDGEGYEYIYAVTDSETFFEDNPESLPDDEWGFDQPQEPWMDNQQRVDPINRYLWLARRPAYATAKKGDAIEEGWEDPYVVIEWGSSQGVGIEYIYARTADEDTAPEVPDNDWPYEQPQEPWGIGDPVLDKDNAVSWRAKRKVFGAPAPGDEVVDEWSAPAVDSRFAGDGAPGLPGSGHIVTYNKHGRLDEAGGWNISTGDEGETVLDWETLTSSQSMELHGYSADSDGTDIRDYIREIEIGDFITLYESPRRWIQYRVVSAPGISGGDSDTGRWLIEIAYILHDDFDGDQDLVQDSNEDFQFRYSRGVAVEGATGPITGTERVYALTATNLLPASQLPNNVWGYKQPLISGHLNWVSDPPSISGEFPYLWRALRIWTVPAEQGTPNVGDPIADNFTPPTLLSYFSQDGADGEDATLKYLPWSHGIPYDFRVGLASAINGNGDWALETADGIVTTADFNWNDITHVHFYSQDETGAEHPFLFGAREFDEGGQVIGIRREVAGAVDIIAFETLGAVEGLSQSGAVRYRFAVKRYPELDAGNLPTFPINSERSAILLLPALNTGLATFRNRSTGWFWARVDAQLAATLGNIQSTDDWPTLAEAAATRATPGGPKPGDIVSLYRAGSLTPQARFYNLDTDKWEHFEGFVGGNLVVNGGIAGEHLQAGSVNAEKIVVGGVNGTHIQEGSIQTQHVEAEAITAELLAVDAITAGSIVSEKIAALAVTTAKINLGAITFSRLDPLLLEVVGTGAYAELDEVALSDNNGAGGQAPLNTDVVITRNVIDEEIKVIVEIAGDWVFHVGDNETPAPMSEVNPPGFFNIRVDGTFSGALRIGQTYETSEEIEGTALQVIHGTNYIGDGVGRNVSVGIESQSVEVDLTVEQTPLNTQVKLFVRGGHTITWNGSTGNRYTIQSIDVRYNVVAQEVEPFG